MSIDVPAISFLILAKQIIQLRKISPILPAIFWLIVTTVLLCLPGSAFPKENWFDKIWLDKWIHIGLFGLLALLWVRAAANSRERKIPLVVQIAFYCLLYGVVMEFVQKYFIPNRSFDIADIVADGVGSVIGALLSNLKVYKKNRPL